ncbi:helix-turn-helix domain-containing protein, partial [Bacteroides uniformis]|uniref:helix-turn-helix domain-containing protein n=1 Tax=Bacteroides uniformis TaxID=820 RepID=UPI0039777FCC
GGIVECFKGAESLGFRGQLTLDFPALSLVINKLEILEEKFSTLMTQIQPDKGLEWLSVSELSEYLPTHPVEHTIYCWTSNKQIPFHKKGKRIMFLKSEIDEWMQDNKSRSRAEIMNEAIAYVQSTRKVI